MSKTPIDLVDIVVDRAGCDGAVDGIVDSIGDDASAVPGANETPIVSDLPCPISRGLA